MALVMTENKRILLNIVATYGRALLCVACGLFSARWVLEALGEQDFGLFGVVGGLAVFMEFLNGQFAGAVSRFYGVAIGACSISSDKDSALENCRAWFSTAVSVHVIVPLALMVIGYPAGVYALEQGWVRIPPDRLESCVWVWRFACLNCTTAMMASPMWAMYMAKQNIAEMTVYGVGQTLAKTCFVYYMSTMPGDWLARYGLMTCLVATIPRVLYCVGAFINFKECRLRRQSLTDWGRIRKLIAFASWETFAAIGNIVKGQGVAIAVNNTLGPKVNSAMAFGGQLAGESASLTGAMLNAFSPAIVSAYGAKRYDTVKTMAFRACKFGVLLILVFAIPLVLEVDQVLLLWLKNPPLFAREMCVAMVLVLVIEKLSQGHGLAIAATGNIASHRILRGLAYGMSVPVVLLGVVLGYGVYAVVVALICSAIVAMLCDIYVARSVLSMEIKYWIRAVVSPVLIVGFIVSLLAAIPSIIMPPSLIRVFVTSGVSALVFVVAVYFAGLDVIERGYVMTQVRRLAKFMKG